MVANIIYVFKIIFKSKQYSKKGKNNECVTLFIVGNSAVGWEYTDVFYGEMCFFFLTCQMMVCVHVGNFLIYHF